MSSAKPETYEIEGRRIVVSKVQPEDHHQRSRWIVEIDGVERGWIVFPAGFGKDPEAWPLTGQPKFHRDNIGKAYTGSPPERRKHLAKCFIEFMAKGGQLPSAAEIAEAEERAIAAKKAAARSHEESKSKWIAGGVALVTELRALRDRHSRTLTNSEVNTLEEAIEKLYSAYPPEVREQCRIEGKPTATEEQG